MKTPMRSASRTWPNDYLLGFYVGNHMVSATPALKHAYDQLDAREMVKQLADIGVDYIAMYACDGLTWHYATELPPGHLSPFHRGRDFFGEVADECARQGLGFVGACAGGVQALLQTHPEWCHYHPTVAPGSHTAWCMNTGFGDYFRQVIEELARRYPLNGIFVDGLTFGDVLCCRECAERFKEAVGVAPPTVRDMSSPLYRVFRAWSYRELARQLRELRDVVASVQPGATFTHNCFLFYQDDLHETAEAVSYPYNDPGIGIRSKKHGLDRVPVLASVYQAITRGGNRFRLLADQMVNPYPSVVQPEAYAAVTATILARGGAAEPGCFLDHHGRLSTTAVAVAGAAIALERERQPWSAEGEPVRFAGLYLSQTTHDFYAGGNFDARYMDEFRGAHLMLQQEHLPCDALTLRDLPRLAEYPVVFLPNAVCLGDPEIEAFRGYVSAGGTLVSSYRTSLCDEWGDPRGDFGLGELFGVHYTGEKLEPAAKRPLLLVLPEGAFDCEPWEDRAAVLPQTALLCTVRPGAEALARVHDFYRRSPEIPDLYGPHCFMKEEPAGPAIVVNRFGRGRSVYVAAKVFSAYLHSGIAVLRRAVCRDMIREEIRGKLLLKLRAPESVEMMPWAQADRSRILVHLVNLQSAPGRMPISEAGTPDPQRVLPVHGLELETLFKSGDIRSAVLQPAGEVLSMVERDGRAVITIPRLHIHEIVELNLAEGACPVYPNSHRRLEYPRLDLRKRVQEWLATNPSDYDPNAEGYCKFDQWPSPAPGK
ncbi:MAG: hypothetical protein HY321_09955 [Armatimonadetes bacterium]|nr:hypothetical protein [Armatimonadota bacterium]